jgi:hypothetical protein
MTNVPKLRKVMEQLDAAPDVRGEHLLPEGVSFDQSIWLRSGPDLRITEEHGIVTEVQGEVVHHWCRTAACVAGLTAILFAPPGTVLRSQCVILPGDGPLADFYRAQRISDFAQAELELTDRQARWLFAGRNSREMVSLIAAELIAEQEAADADAARQLDPPTE